MKRLKRLDSFKLFYEPLRLDRKVRTLVAGSRIKRPSKPKKPLRLIGGQSERFRRILSTLAEISQKAARSVRNSQRQVLRVIIRHFKGNYKRFKSWLSKRHKHQIIYFVGFIVIAGLATGFTAVLSHVADMNRDYQKQRKGWSDSQSKLQQNFKQLEQQKVQREQELQKQIDELNKQLQAKKDAEANRIALRQGGTGGVVSSSPPYISSTGNSYDYGYCTWYVKNRRPDIPNNWDNAKYWLTGAQLIGWPTGPIPKVGAIGWSGVGWAGHVFIVEKVGSGEIYISEMNGIAGWGKVGYRWVNSLEYQYIY